LASKLEATNLSALSRSVEETYKNFIVSNVNDSCLRLAVFTGEYDWHYHPTSDELFLVLEGELFIDFKEQDTVCLKPNDTITIPAGVIHRSRSIQRTVNLCFEHTDTNTVFM
jgi:mannose-6-phosphate isomerase-like protein (cupin superfamily)